VGLEGREGLRGVLELGDVGREGEERGRGLSAGKVGRRGVLELIDAGLEIARRGRGRGLSGAVCLCQRRS
jgi:hypothetical protein